MANDPTMPVLRAWVSWSTAPLATPDYTGTADITNYLLDEGFSIRRGRQDETGPYQAGRLTLTLDNRDRRFDPEYTSSPYAPNVKPLKRIQINFQWPSGGTHYVVFSGFVENWQPDYDINGRMICRVTAVDAFGAIFSRFTLGNEKILDAYPWPAPALPLQGIVIDSVPYAVVDPSAIAPPYDRKVVISVTGNVTYAALQLTGVDTSGVTRVETPTLASAAPVLNPTYTSTYRYRSITSIYVYSTFAPNYDTNIGSPVTISYDNALNAEYSGDMTTTFLNLAGWPTGTSYRLIDNGLSLLQSITLSGAPVLSYLQTISDTEGGQIFIDREGRFRFYNRHKQLLRTTQPTPFGDDPLLVAAGLEIAYSAIDLDYGERYIYNIMRRQRSGGTEQIVRDNTSANAYGPRTYPSRGQTLQTSDSEVKNQALFLLGLYKDPRTRVRRLRFVNGGPNPAVAWPYLLGGDVQQQYTIVQRPGGIGTITLTQVLEGIAITMNAAHQIEIEWSFSPGLPGTPYKVYDHPTLGRFDQNAFAY